MKDLKPWKNIKDENKTALRKLCYKYFYQVFLQAKKSTYGITSLAEDLANDCFTNNLDPVKILNRKN